MGGSGGLYIDAAATENYCRRREGEESSVVGCMIKPIGVSLFLLPLFGGGPRDMMNW